MTDKISPLPWAVDELGAVKSEGQPVVADGFALPVDRRNEKARANTAFIVRACNSHDQLVEALRIAYTMICEEVADGKFTEQAALCREALAAAEKP